MTKAELENRRAYLKLIRGAAQAELQTRNGVHTAADQPALEAIKAALSAVPSDQIKGALDRALEEPGPKLTPTKARERLTAEANRMIAGSNRKDREYDWADWDPEARREIAQYVQEGAASIAEGSKGRKDGSYSTAARCIIEALLPFCSADAHPKNSARALSCFLSWAHDMARMHAPHVEMTERQLASAFENRDRTERARNHKPR